MKCIIFAIILLHNFITYATEIKKHFHKDTYSEYLAQCNYAVDKNYFTIGWRMWEPYQFSHVTSTGRFTITGVDVAITKAVLAKIGVRSKYVEDDWEQIQLDIKNGVKDMTSGAAYSIGRAEYANFSHPYRFEELSLFTSRTTKKNINFHNMSEFLAQIRLTNFRLGVTNGGVYGDQSIVDFLDSKNNTDIIIKYQNDTESFNALERGEIDGFIADRIVGAAIVLANTSTDEIQEIPLNVKVPVHLMFSKKTVSLDVINHVNNIIDELIAKEENVKISKDFTYHLLLPKAIDSEWCYIIGLIGSIAFAFSGIAIAINKDTTLFGAFLLAVLPSIIGCIFLDIIATHNLDNKNFYITPSYIYYTFIIVLVGFSSLKLLDYYNKQLYEDSFLRKLRTNTLVVCDALGQASFTVVGVAMVVVLGIDPLWFWGAAFAWFASNVGVIIRELIIQDHVINYIYGEIAPEIPILWGLIFSILLDMHAYNPSYSFLSIFMIITIAGAFVMRLISHYCKIPNLVFTVRNGKE